MTWTNQHTTLRDQLAELYLERDSAKRIAVDAGVNPTLVHFDDIATNNWSSIIKAAYNQGKLVALIKSALRENPSNGALEVALKYFESRESEVLKSVKHLEQKLSEDDPTLNYILEVLKRFQFFHTALSEWKELHNLLTDVIFTVGQFEREVEGLYNRKQAGDAMSFKSSWRPVSLKIDILLEWAKAIEHIATPFVMQPDGTMLGPSWAIEIQTARGRVEELLNPRDFDIVALYDATCSFVDNTQKKLYIADKSLRETVGELSSLSSIVLGSLPYE